MAEGDDCKYRLAMEKSIDTVCIKLEERHRQVDIRFNALDKALDIASKNAESYRKETREANAEHFKALNDSQKRMDDLKGTFASRENVDKDIKLLSKMIYMGAGIVIALEFLLRFLIKG